MSERDYAQIAAELLAKRKPEARSRLVDRAHGISVVAGAMAARTRLHARVRALKLGGLLAAAAGLALVAGWFGAHSRAQSVASACSAPSCLPSETPARFGTVAGRPFEPGQSIVAGRGRSTVVEFGPVTRIALSELSELEYRDGGRTQRFGLLSGAVHLKVEKLKAGQRFLVETADAQVEVRGTVFDVAVAPPEEACAGSRTRVSVEEGLVEVRSHGKTARIRPGESWPASCDEVLAADPADAAARVAASEKAAPVLHPRSATPARAAETTQPSAAPAAPRDAAASGSKPASEASAPISSALAEQNNLYAEAAALHRSGRSSEALAAYDRLLARFPAGPLAESASVGRLRILAKFEGPRARDEARRYLSRYPRGIASVEAQAFLGKP
ncbi:MAG TPA: FecR domain-containing protein [Polyangiaceae bacterium]|nr:FecR domain-containing protein [Polyangiaceae bacterium]